jgi:DNA-directed RNA polymerase subunit RPC12/RpoP
MIINMACPKCGAQATEYDEKKWSCLRCGNKFVYEPVQPSHTFVQSNVQIQGQATFELDVANAKSPLPKMVKMIEYDPSYFGRQIADINNEISARKTLKFPIYILQFIFGGICAFLLLVGTLGFIVGIFTVLFSAHKEDNGDFIFGVISCAILFIPSYLLFRRYRKAIQAHNLIIQNSQQTIASLEYNNIVDSKIGDHIICPHCENAFEYVHMNTPPPVEGLNDLTPKSWT